MLYWNCENHNCQIKFFFFSTGTQDFLTAPSDVLVHFLKSADIVLDREFTLYTSLKNWTLRKFKPKDLSESIVEEPTNLFYSIMEEPVSKRAKLSTINNRLERDMQQTIEHLFSHIKFTLMTLKELKIILEDSLIAHFSDALIETVKEALQIHAMQIPHTNAQTTQITHKNAQTTHQISINHLYSDGEEDLIIDPELVGFISPDMSDDNLHVIICTKHPDDIDQPIKSLPSKYQPIKNHQSKDQPMKHQPESQVSMKYPLKCESPRIYTCDSWCTEVIVNDIDLINPGDVIGAFFSSPVTGCEEDDSFYWDWHVNLYLKGVSFKKCMMIGMVENKEIDEVIYEKVRLTVTSNSAEERKVKVSVLVCGIQNGVEYVAREITKLCTFSNEDTLCNINDVIPFAEISNDSSIFRIGEEMKGLKFIVIVRPVVKSV